MQALVFHGPGRPLAVETRPIPVPGPRQLLVKVAACAVCRTDLHIVDGDLEHPALPLVPGHEVVGRVQSAGPGTEGRFPAGDRVGAAWLGRTCGQCRFCAAGRENLCDDAVFTGYTADGGYAGYMLVDERFAVRIPDRYGDAEAAPLLCAGLIGYRSLVMAGDAERLGIYGFGAAAHIVAQVAVAEGRRVHAFTRPGDAAGQAFARSLGCAWAGGSDRPGPEPLDAAIVFAPVGALAPAALAALDKGGIVVCGGIHMSDIPTFPYRLLWGERRIASVANLTRSDAEAFMDAAARIDIRTSIECFDLAEADTALESLRRGRLQGAAVLVPRRSGPPDLP